MTVLVRVFNMKSTLHISSLHADNDLYTNHRCASCGASDSFIYDQDLGENVCTGCGVANKEPLNRGPEWREFTFEDSEKSRMGPPSSPLYSGMSTTFKPRERGLTSQQRREFSRLKHQDSMAIYGEGQEGNLGIAMIELDKLSSKLSLPDLCKESAAHIYRLALKSGLVRGRSIDGMMAASLYAATRMDNEVTRTLKEVAKNSSKDKKEIARCYRLLLRELEIRMPVPNARAPISKIAYKLKVSMKSEKLAHVSMKSENLAHEILKNVKKYKATAGKGPISLAAAALYVACRESGEGRTQGEIAKAAGTTEVTIRNILKNWEDLSIYKNGVLSMN